MKIIERKNYALGQIFLYEYSIWRIKECFVVIQLNLINIRS